MQLLCHALITGDHPNADAITAAIGANDQGTPAHLFLIVVSFRHHPLSPLIPPSINRACLPPPSIDRSCHQHPSQSSHQSSIVNHDAAVHLSLTATTTARAQQIAAEALLGLVPEATADIDIEFVEEEGTVDDELIVGLIDSLSIGDSNDKSMEDPAGDAAVGNGADGDEADGDREDRNVAMSGLRQMGQRLHQFDILESLFDDVTGFIEWGEDHYDITSLFDVSNLAKRGDMGPSDGSGMAAMEGSM